jgi:hypothetical protein
VLTIGTSYLCLIDAGNEELRVQISTLRYELENVKQERDFAELRHEKELRELQARADADFRKAQVRILCLSPLWLHCLGKLLSFGSV